MRTQKRESHPLTTVGQLPIVQDSIPQHKKAGVYELFCGDFEVKYIGQTGRPFRVYEWGTQVSL